jgi:hypothetical protein
MEASGQGGIPELRQHSPLSAFDRDLKRIKLHLDLKRQLVRVAVGGGVAFAALLATLGILASLEVLTWRTAGIAIGAGAMLVGLSRWLINALLHRRQLAAAKRLRPLDADERDYLRTMAARRQDLQVELDIWNMLSDELSVAELEIVKRWSNEQR